MDSGSVAILALIVVNITGVAYSYGKLNQKVDDLKENVCQRLTWLEDTLNCPKDK